MLRRTEMIDPPSQKRRLLLHKYCAAASFL